MQGFDAQNPPFDRLNHTEIDKLRAAIDVGYFAPGTVIVAKGASSEFLHVILKGAVAERDEQDILGTLGPKDTFDAGAVVHGSASASFVANEETLCFLLPKPVILDLVQKNQAFAAFFYTELSRRLESFASQRNTQGFDSVLRSRVKDARWAKAIFVDGNTTIKDAGHIMAERDCNAIFVREDNKLGLITGMTLSKALILQGRTLTTPVRDICRFEVASVDNEDFIFDALLAMTRHKKRRIAIRSDDTFVGILEDIDILELFAGNSQLIPGRIDRAKTVADLVSPAADIQAQVQRLHEHGVKIDVIAEITSDLNRNLLAKVFAVTAPASIQEHGCLLVMGSEGRGEQTVRTDQDNGLLLAQELPEADLAEFRAKFTDALEQLGFPPCPGNVMVRNPLWSQTVDNFVKQVKSWIFSPTGESAMDLGIFCDAVSVTGRSELLVHAKKVFMEFMRGEVAHLAHFARQIDLFESSDIGPLGNLMVSVGMRSGAVNIKKIGTFPIVHGIRTLAIDKGIMQTSTIARIQALSEEHLWEPAFAANLISALQVFMELRLRSQLKARRLGALEGESVVQISELSSTDRDILRNALRVGRQFRELVRHRYNLGYF